MTISANIFDAKTNFSRYISLIENGSQPFIVIKKGNRPVAKIVPYDEAPVRKIGIAKDMIPSLQSIETFNDIETGMLEGSDFL